MTIGGVSSLLRAVDRVAVHMSVGVLIDAELHGGLDTESDAAGVACRLREIVSYAKRGSDRPFSLWAAPPPRCVLGGAWEALYERLEV
eukprot:gene131-5360_t